MFVLSVLSKMQRWLRQRATRIQLSQLSDRELRDIGLNRMLIETVARSATRHR